MFKGKLLIVALWMGAGAAHAMDFSPQPVVNPAATTLNFDLGEGALTSYLRHHFKETMSYSDPILKADVTLTEAEVDLVPNEGKITLKLKVRYTYGLVGGTETMNCERVFNSSAVQFLNEQGKVRIDLNQTLPCAENLPPYLKSRYQARQSPFNNLPYVLEIDVGPRTFPQVGTQMDTILPLFYAGGGTTQTQIVDNCLRFSISPQWEVERNTVQAYFERVGSSTRIVFITNFSAEISTVLVKKVVWGGTWIPVLSITGPIPPGPGGLQTDPLSSNPRYSRYNYTTPFFPTTARRVSATLSIGGISKRKFNVEGSFNATQSSGYIPLTVNQ